MKTFLSLIIALGLTVGALAQPAPWYEATTGQVATGTAGAPFAVTPRGLAGAGFTPGGGGGGSSSSVFSNLVATNFSYGRLSPFVGPTYFIFVGNSRFTNFGNVPIPDILVSNYFIPVLGTNYRGYTNFSVPGLSVEQINTSVITSVLPLKPQGPTNVWVFYLDSVNDPLNGTNLTVTLDTQSNMFQALFTNNFTTAAILAWEPEGFTALQDGVLARVNYNILTNDMIQYKINLTKRWNIRKPYMVQSDGLHFTTHGATNAAKIIMEGIIGTFNGYSDSSSVEGRFNDFLQVSSDNFLYSFRGLNTAIHIAGDYPSTLYDAGTHGAAWLGTIKDFGDGAFFLYLAAGSGNTAQSMSFTAGGTTNVGKIGAGLGFATTTNSAVAPAAITFPSTTVPWTNTFGINITLYIDNTGVTGTTLSKNGQQIYSAIIGDNIITMKPGDYFSEAYTIGTPSGRWEPR